MGRDKLLVFTWDGFGLFSNNNNDNDNNNITTSGFTPGHTGGV